MDNKGQAYSAFQLLIAAIVAIAILGILISIIIIVVPPGNDLPTVAKQMIEKQKENRGAISTSGKVKFMAGSSLAPTALVEGTGLSPDQVCIHKGDLVNDAALKMQGSVLVNSSNNDREAKVSVICNGANSLLASINELELFQGDIEFDGEKGKCNCPIDNEAATQLCCAVMLKYS